MVWTPWSMETFKLTMADPVPAALACTLWRAPLECTPPSGRPSTGGTAYPARSCTGRGVRPASLPAHRRRPKHEGTAPHLGTRSEGSGFSARSGQHRHSARACRGRPGCTHGARSLRARGMQEDAVRGSRGRACSPCSETGPTRSQCTRRCRAAPTWAGATGLPGKPRRGHTCGRPRTRLGGFPFPDRTGSSSVIASDMRARGG